MSQPESPKALRVEATARALMLDYLDRVAEHFGFVRVGESTGRDRVRALFESDDGEAEPGELDPEPAVRQALSDAAARRWPS